MNRRHVLQTLAVMAVGSRTVVALSGTVNTRLTAITQRDFSNAMRESRELCLDLLTSLSRVDSRSDLFVSASTVSVKTATQALEELTVLLEGAEARICDTELRPVALLQACVDSLLRVETPLKSLYQQGVLPRPIVDSSVAAFGQARQLLSNHHTA